MTPQPQDRGAGVERLDSNPPAQDWWKITLRSSHLDDPAVSANTLATEKEQRSPAVSIDAHKIDSQVAAQPSGGREGANLLIPVPRRLLDELQTSEDRLNNYVDAYICCQEIRERCATIKGWLTRGLGELEQLKKDFYWEDLLRELDLRHVDLISLQRLDPTAQATDLERALGMVRGRVTDVLERVSRYAPDLAELRDNAQNLKADVDSANRLAGEVAKKCEAGSRETMGTIDRCLTQMFAGDRAGAESVTEQNARGVASTSPKNVDQPGSIGNA